MEGRARVFWRIPSPAFLVNFGKHFRCNQGVLTIRWLLLGLALVVGGAQSQGQESVEKNKANSSQNKQRAATDQRGTEKSPLVIKGFPVEKTEEQTEYEHYEHTEKPINERLAAWSTAALVAVTAALAFFTYFLWGATKDLVERTDKTSRTHERAYIFGGGPMQRTRPNMRSDGVVYPVAMDAPEIMCMTIQNYGRSTGFVKKVQWGLCSADQFPLDVPVSELIAKNLLPSGVVQTADRVDDIYPPTGMTVMPYRHVLFNHTKNVGKIFFGRIDFEDTFGAPHYSTFKLLLTKDGSDPLLGCYSDDWD